MKAQEITVRPHVFFKVIRMEELINTRNGRRPPFDNRVSCNGINGDDDPGVFATRQSSIL
ncbi:MAG: hypothetical protein IPL98_19530 [Saprospiraceae bacterium]|nr:hypothetical protein [Saprospiraceae bacterium]